jgi:flagellar export protein FliJ
LKTKEEAESKLNEYVKSEVIAKIREQTLYIDMLKRQINALEREVQIARKNMEKKRQIVTEKHVELKKIEKMIEKRKEQEKNLSAQLEMKQMDEISLNRFIRAE